MQALEHDVRQHIEAYQEYMLRGKEYLGRACVDSVCSR